MQLAVDYQIVGSHRTGRSQTSDFSPEGVRFVSEQPLPVGTEIEVSLQLPDRKDPVRFLGEVMWSQDRLQPSTGTEVGVRFLKISKRDQDMLAHYGRLFGPA
jgi:hypothetical protein